MPVTSYSTSELPNVEKSHIDRTKLEEELSKSHGSGETIYIEKEVIKEVPVEVIKEVPTTTVIRRYKGYTPTSRVINISVSGSNPKTATFVAPEDGYVYFYGHGNNHNDNIEIDIYPDITNQPDYFIRHIGAACTQTYYMEVHPFIGKGQTAKIKITSASYSASCYRFIYSAEGN